MTLTLSAVAPQFDQGRVLGLPPGLMRWRVHAAAVGDASGGQVVLPVRFNPNRTNNPFFVLVTRAMVEVSAGTTEGIFGLSQSEPYQINYGGVSDPHWHLGGDAATALAVKSFHPWAPLYLGRPLMTGESGRTSHSLGTMNLFATNGGAGVTHTFVIGGVCAAEAFILYGNPYA